MHTYIRPTTIPDPFPGFDEMQFRGVLDVVAHAEQNLSIGLNTWPEVWHLDGEGRLTCAGPRSSCNTIKRWARDPSDLFRVRRDRQVPACGDNWLIVDSRNVFYDPPIVDEGDIEAFVVLRRKLRTVGVHLVDAVVFDDSGHWWSLHELTTGTLTWDAIDMGDQ